MEEFGVRFSRGKESDFDSLRRLFLAIKNDKDEGVFRCEDEWVSFVPEKFRPNYYWPDSVGRSEWLDYSKDKPIAIPDVSNQLSAKWDFYCIVDAFHSGDYDLLGCEKIGNDYEMHIYPYGYPYGGIGPLIALAEGFGFQIEGINEYGKYLDKSDLKASG